MAAFSTKLICLLTICGGKMRFCGDKVVSSWSKILTERLFALFKNT